MRNLILAVIGFTLTVSNTVAQSIKVEGTAGYSGNYITQFDGDYFTISRNDGFAVLDLQGKVLMSGIKAPIVGMYRQFNLYHGTLFVDNGGNMVLKKAIGQTLGAGTYKEILPFTTDNTLVRLPSPPTSWAVAYIDTLGKEIVRFDLKKYLSIVQPNKPGSYALISLSQFFPFSDGLTPIRSQITGQYGYINKKLELAIPFGFKNAQPFSNGLAAVENADGNWGFINTSGKLVIPYTYSLPPSRFMSDLAKVQSKEGKFGFINKENAVVIQPKYEFATSFYKGYALARESYSLPIDLIDSAGSVIATFPKDLLYIDNSKTPPGIFGEEQSEYPFYTSPTLQQLVDEGKGIFQKGISYGLMDNKGQVVLDFKYQHLSDLHKGKLFAHYSGYVNNATKNQLGIIDDKGNWLIEISPSQF